MNESHKAEVRSGSIAATGSNNGKGPSAAVLAPGQQKRVLEAGRPPHRSPEERREERVKRVLDPNSILLVNKTQEGWMLSSLLFPFDKAIQRLRRGIGSRVPFEDAQAVLAKVELWSNQVKELLRPFGGMDVEYRWREPIGDNEERKRIANGRNAIVIVPRVQDTARMAPLIRAVDDALLRLRMEAQSLEVYRDVFEKVASLVVELHRIIVMGSALTNTPYAATGDVARLVRHRESQK